MINIKFVIEERKQERNELFIIKIVYEIGSLQQEIDRRRQNIPQTYREALNRAETMHEITRLYDVGRKIHRKEKNNEQICFRVVKELCEDFVQRRKL